MSISDEQWHLIDNAIEAGLGPNDLDGKGNINPAELWRKMYNDAFDRGLIYERCIRHRVNLDLIWRVQAASITNDDMVTLGMDKDGYDADHFNRVLK